MRVTFTEGALVRLNEAGRLKMRDAAKVVGYDVTQPFSIGQLVTVLGHVMARLVIRDARGEVISRPYVFAELLEPVAPARP